jgi:LuxR family transcriptional regulator, maltose regulon positive regulatory protein
VLDDYHLVDGPDIETGMAFLLEHLPPSHPDNSHPGA